MLRAFEESFYRGEFYVLRSFDFEANGLLSDRAVTAYLWLFVLCFSSTPLLLLSASQFSLFSYLKSAQLTSEIITLLLYSLFDYLF